jgi:predicted MFS family arabinose efflux permease
MSEARAANVALAVTLAIQVFTALTGAATAVLAPEIGRDLGVPTRLVGIFVSLMFVGSMVASLASGYFISTYGAIRVSQVCVLICALGIAIIALLPPQAAPLLALAALILGIGYGAITPASSEILARTASPERMALTFSIKQTGVPGGAALAGALLPPLALNIGWRPALFCTAASGLAIAAIAQSTRRRLDNPQVTTAFSIATLITPLFTVLKHPVLRELALVGFVYSAMQVCLMSFLVVYLAESLGYSLVAAGAALTTAGVGGIAGRLLWGAVADRWVRPRRLLGIIGVGAATAAYAAACFSNAWPPVALLAVAAIFGAFATGWNGVQLSQVARSAPAGSAGTITGASGFLSFAGLMLGAPLFALCAIATDSYRAGYIAFGTASLLCGATLLMHRVIRG